MNDSAKTVLIAMEIGGNAGHLARSFHVASKLKQVGCRVILAVTDLLVATMLNTEGFAVVQAPVNRDQRPLPNRPLINHAEVLHMNGYANSLSLSVLINGWLGLMSTIKPSVVIIDYAPTAGIAARLFGARTLLLGSGFDMPPDISPMPAFILVNGAPLPNKDLMKIENDTVELVNSVIGQVGQKISRLHDLFDADRRIITTLPDLDPWGARVNETYVGPIDGVRSCIRVEWNDKASDKKRVFAYVRGNMAGLESIFAALGAIDAEVICVMLGARESFVRQVSTDKIRVYSSLVDVAHLLPDTSAIFCYGGAGVVAFALLNGVPMVLVPDDVDKVMTSTRAVGLGAAISIQGNAKPEVYTSAINTVMTEPSYAAAARKVADKYSDYDQERSVEFIAESVIALMVNQQ